MSLLIALSACIQGSSLPPLDGIVVSLTDPSGTEWVTTEADVARQQIAGPNCVTAEWYFVSGGDPPLYLWFGVVPSAPVLMEEDVLVAHWNSEPDPRAAGYLFGGEGEMVADELTRLEYRVVAGEDCTIPVEGGDYECSLRASDLIIVFEDPNLDLVPTEDRPGAEGWATNPNTGEAVCGAEAPGT